MGTRAAGCRRASSFEYWTAACDSASPTRGRSRRAALGRFLVRLGLVGLYALAACSYLKSDEELLREEFRIPRGAALDSMSVYPKEAGWFGREGLTIDAVFRFSPEQFETYRRRAEQDDRWKPMPPSRGFLMKMLGIRSHIEGVARSYALQGKPVPPAGSVYNPTEEQLYDRLTARLPLDVEHGLYQCRTAGNDIMHLPKIPCSSVEGDLNDYMFAVLDFDKKLLRIKVHASY